MDETLFIKTIITRPVLKGINIDLLSETILGLIPVAINRIVNRKRFNFSVGVSTVETVAGETDYVLPGDNSDAVDIISIKYGDDLETLDKLGWMDQDDDLDRIDTSLVGVYGWARINDDDLSPQARLIGTPSVDGDTIQYRYRRKNIPFGDFPSEWTYVLQDSLMACLGNIGVGANGEMIRLGHTQAFNKSVTEMVDHYDKQSGPQPVKTDSATRNRNIERNAKYGY